jgi:hypothetical protein
MDSFSWSKQCEAELGGNSIMIRSTFVRLKKWVQRIKKRPKVRFQWAHVTHIKLIHCVRKQSDLFGAKLEQQTNEKNLIADTQTKAFATKHFSTTMLAFQQQQELQKSPSLNHRQTVVLGIRVQSCTLHLILVWYPNEFTTRPSEGKPRFLQGILAL